MTIVIIRKKGDQLEIFNNVETSIWLHQRGNGNWLKIHFKKRTPEYEEFKNQNGEVDIGTDNYDEIITY